MRILGRELTLTRVQPVAQPAEELKVQPQPVQPFEQVLLRLIGEGYGNPEQVTPESCMRSPTVHAIVTAVARRVAVSRPKVYRLKRVKPSAEEAAEGDDGATRERKERVPNHPVEKLLNSPNQWQTSVDYWLDSVSRFIRYGNHWAYLSRGSTGPIRELIPLRPDTVAVYQDINTWAVTYKVLGQDTPFAKLHHVRGASRFGLIGDSPVTDVADAIALEIAAEKFGTSFFANGALPLMIFKYIQGTQGFKDAEQEKQFVKDVQQALSGSNRHRALLLPKGVDTSSPVITDNDKAQMLETRRYQRTVIAGAFGIPPHLVGDLERATFNNVEQQSVDFTVNVVAPVCQAFQASLERDLLTQDDRNSGIIIRFDLDSMQLVDFASRQAGLQIQRNAGVISPNDWRQMENMNPISDKDGGEDYIRPANFVVSGDPIPAGAPGGPPLPTPAPKPAPKPEAGKVLAEKMGELCELFDKAAKRDRPVVINTPPQPAPVVHVYPAEVHIAPAQVKIDAPITVEAPQIHMPSPAPPPEPVPMDLFPERGKDGRVIAIRHRPAKG